MRERKTRKTLFLGGLIDGYSMDQLNKYLLTNRFQVTVFRMVSASSGFFKNIRRELESVNCSLTKYALSNASAFSKFAFRICRML